MANFNGFVPTAAGRDLVARSQAQGFALEYTVMKYGDGLLGTEPVEALTDLRHPVTSSPVEEVEKVNGTGRWNASAVLRNKELQEGFYWREWGVFAKDPATGGEVLLVYSSAGQMADYIPAGGSASVVEKRTVAEMVIGAVAEIKVEVTPDQLYASKEELLKHAQDTAMHLGINAAATASGTTVAITAPAGVEFLAFYAPRDFSSGDNYTLNGTSITLTDLRGEPLEDAWKQGSPVQLAVKGNQAFFKGGAGGINQTLPPQVTGLTAKASSAPNIVVSWTNPAEYWAGTLIVRKAGSAPEGVNDGEKVCNGTGNSFTDTNVTYDTPYYYRAFPYNPKKQYQTLLTGAVVSATPKKLPLPAQVTGFTLTASTAAITLNWVNPTANWTGTLIVRKAGSQPDSVTDGTAVYDGTGTSYVDTTAARDTTYYYRAFPYNANKEYQTSTVGAVVSGMLKNSIPLSSVKEGGLISLKENGVPANYLVVHQGKPSSIYDASCDGTWLLRQDIAENRVWEADNVNKLESSDIHAYLNGTWLNRYDANIKNAIKQVKNPYRQNGGSGGTDRTGANGLSCKIFLLSGREVGFTNNESSYFPVDGAKLAYFLSGNDSTAQQKRIAKLNGSDSHWWLRSPYTSSTNYVWFARSDGDWGGLNANNSFGVRPAFTLPATLELNPDPNPDGSYRPMT